MNAVKKRAYISVEEYLAGEKISPVRHEYRDGVVYAMAGARNAHNIIKGNIYHSLRTHLENHSCQPFDSDTKIRIRTRGHTRFYYPDVSLVCRPNPQSDSYQDAPVAIFEVLSHGTRRIDEGEKKEAYLEIPSLSLYVLLEQELPLAVVYRRTPEGFVRETYEGLDARLSLGEAGVELSLADVYERVEFSEEAGEETAV